MMVRFNALLLAFFAAISVAVAQPVDHLASWNDGAAKNAIIDFVARTTACGTPDFVPLGERIANFDNDGTLWAEQPVYFQLAFAFGRVKALAPQHPERQTKQPFKALLDKDMKALGAAGEKGLLQIMAAAHTGMTAATIAHTQTLAVAPAARAVQARPVQARLAEEMER
ncbi:hypothetical protein [Bradyrhizobium sp. RDI18]|uniref:hypothetical protein n=1 Tax=Bradyrhizobium sp. RDI18 TaxID=3367400 RepID=UPI00372358D1